MKDIETADAEENRVTNSYDVLARYYDDFQSKETLLALRDFILEAMSSFLEDSKADAPILLGDLGCGSGSLVLALSEHLEQSIKITAIDLSDAMLAECSKKALGLGDLEERVRFVQADMCQYEFSETQDVLLAMTDSLNHLSAERMVDLFSLAAENLRSGGLFIFDLLKQDFLTQERGSRCFFAELAEVAGEPKLSMVWENEWIEEETMAISHLTFFELQMHSGLYLRSTDEIIEYYHDLNSVENLWWGSFDCVDIQDTEERRFFVLKRL